MSTAENAAIRDAAGVVKWFDARRGYGFILGPDGQDIFTHYTVIQGAGFRILKEGWRVTYDAELTSTGWRSTRVIPPAGMPTDGSDPDAPMSFRDGLNPRVRRARTPRDSQSPRLPKFPSEAPRPEVVVRPRRPASPSPKPTDPSAQAEDAPQ